MSLYRTHNIVTIVYQNWLRVCQIVMVSAGSLFWGAMYSYRCASSQTLCDVCRIRLEPNECSQCLVYKRNLLSSIYLDVSFSTQSTSCSVRRVISGSLSALYATSREARAKRSQQLMYTFAIVRRQQVEPKLISQCLRNVVTNVTRSRSLRCW